MTELRKAELIPLLGDEGGTRDPARGSVEVQFNPATLRLQLTNQSEGGRSRGRQAEQYLGKGATTLTLDLHFDTADTGENVQKLTKQIEQFVLPVDRGGKQAPPRLRFHWGDLVFDGLMSGISEDIDLFSSAGVPLRAKLSVTIKGQDPEFARREMGAGANTGSNALPVGGTSAPPGSAPVPARLADRTGVALGGESAAGFAARMGLDPAAWRGLSVGLDASLSLPAGLEIDFSSGLSASAGLGVSSGVEAAAGNSVETRFGLAAGAGAGFALAAAGGLRAAVDAVAQAKADSAAADARRAFGVPAPRVPAPAAGAVAPLASPGVTRTAPAAPAQERGRLASRALPAPGRTSPPAPQPPPADPRGSTFGFGAPLRPRVAGAALERGGPFAARVVVRVRPARTHSDPSLRDLTAAPWTALRPPGPGALAGAMHCTSSPCSCGCGGGR